MATFIGFDGEERQVTPANGKSFTLEEMQEFVDGLVEVLRMSPTEEMIINEEGKLEGQPPNRKATNIALRAGVIFFGDYIAGNAVVGNPHEFGWKSVEEHQAAEAQAEESGDEEEAPDTHGGSALGQFVDDFREVTSRWVPPPRP